MQTSAALDRARHRAPAPTEQLSCRALDEGVRQSTEALRSGAGPSESSGGDPMSRPPAVPQPLRARSRCADAAERVAVRGVGPVAQLAGEDSAWLHMDRPSNPMVITALLELDGVIAMPVLRGILEDRLLRFDRFRERVVEPALGAGAPSWQRDPEFALERHVFHHVLRSADDTELRAAIDAVASSVLDRRHPLWQMHVFERPECGTVIVARIHHAIADGFALLGVLLALCDGTTRADSPGVAPRDWLAATRAAMARLGEHLAQPRRVLGDVGLAARGLTSLARLVLLPPDHRSQLRGPLGSHKRVAWTRPLALSAIKTAGRREGATVNDVVMAALAGGLRRYLLRGGTRVRDIRAMIPVNQRALGRPVQLGNRFGLVVLALPLEIAAPRPRLRELKRRMDALKRSAEALVGMAIVSAMGLAPRGLESLGVRFFSAKASMVLTNVPGPRTALRFGGHTLSRMLFWVPQSGDLGLGLSIFSYVDTVSIGVMADAIRVPDPERLVADIEDALTEILA